jgi:hypothetical protein
VTDRNCRAGRGSPRAELDRTLLASDRSDRTPATDNTGRNGRRPNSAPDLNKNKRERWFNPAGAGIRTLGCWIELQENQLTDAPMLFDEGSSST